MEKILIVIITSCYLFLCSNLNGQIPYNNDIVIEDITYNNQNVIKMTGASIIAAGDPSKPVVITGNSKVTFFAGEEIHLGPGFEVTGLQGDGAFGAHINPTIQVALIEPLNTNFEVGKYDKLEIGIKLPGNINALIDDFLNGYGGINPFNPDDINLYAYFVSPTGIVHYINGFYFQDYTRNLSNGTWNNVPTEYDWRIRFAPDETGEWTFNIIMQSGYQGISPIVEENFKFSCVPSSNLGYLEVGHHKRYLRFNNGQSFFPVGYNLWWMDDDGYDNINSNKGLQVEQYLNNSASQDVNYMRIGLVENFYRLEKEEIGIYNMSRAWEFDQVINNAKMNDIYLQITLHHHASLMYQYDPTCWGEYWETNPYSFLPGVNFIHDFFTNVQAKKYYKNYIRYIIARWGYSTNIAAWDQISEYDNIGKARDGDGVSYGTAYVYDSNRRAELLDWSTEMYNFLKSGDPNHLITLSFAQDEANEDFKDFWLNATDIRSTHVYGEHEEVNYVKRYDAIEDLHEIDGVEAPVLITEMGTNVCIIDCNPIEFHQSIWATAMSGGLGAGLWWWWQRLSGDNYNNQPYFEHFKPLHDFMNSFDFETNKYEPQTWKDWPTKHYFSYVLKNFDKTKAMGWYINRTHWWRYYANLPQEICLHDLMETGICEGSDISGLFNPNDDDIPIGFTENLEIHGLKSFAEYRIRHFNTNTGVYYQWVTCTTNLLGTLKPDARYTDINNPDWAFEIEYINNKSTAADSTPIDSMIVKNNIENNYKDNLSTAEEMEFKVILYPNPCNEIITITISGCQNYCDLVITDLYGRIIYTRHELGEGQFNMDVSDLSSGLYFIKFMFDGEIIVEKIIIE